MNQIKVLLVILFLNIVNFSPVNAQSAKVETVYHEMDIQLNPMAHQLNIHDKITLPKSIIGNKIQFYLNKTLKIENASIRLNLTTTNDHLNVYEFFANHENFELIISGSLNNPVTNQDSIGHIGPEGVSLFPSTGWYPYFFNSKETAKVKILTEKNWNSIFSGNEIYQKNSESAFENLNPQVGLYLFSNSFTKYSKTQNNFTTNIYLKNPDPSLANQLLNSLLAYESHYSQKYGSYIYNEFNVIENFWETGYGIPAITLLGPQVIKLPFLLNSSIPHELLHSWWGNGVYVDATVGNWCEGLTVYGADHWQQAVLFKDALYRRNTLAQYQEFVNEKNEFSVSEFKYRYDVTSQAIGYGKSMMIFHMIKKLISEKKFDEALVSFYSNEKFNVASWLTLQSYFQNSSKLDLDFFFKTWLFEKGQVELKIELTQKKLNKLSFEIEQLQKGTFYHFQLPYTIENSDGTLSQNSILINQRKQILTISISEKNKTIQFDKYFDVFRKVQQDEIPTTFSTFFAKKNIKVLSENGFSNEITSLLSQKYGTQVESIKDIKELDQINSNIFIEGHFESIKEIITKYSSIKILDTQKIQIEDKIYELSKDAFAIVFKKKENIFFWFNSPDKQTTVKNIQRMTHYSQFSVVAFQGNGSIVKETIEPFSNVFKFDL